jgi:hypothetical protein
MTIFGITLTAQDIANLIRAGALLLSILALGISVFTYFTTVGGKFKGIVIPTRRISLTWIEIENEQGQTKNQPCIYLECEFINQGPRPGKIEDVILEFANKNKGSHNPLYAYYVKKEDIFDIYMDDAWIQPEDTMSDFSTTWLNPRELRHQAIFFIQDDPSTSVLDARQDQICSITLLYSGDRAHTRVRFNGEGLKKKYWGAKINWRVSEVSFDVLISRDNAREWKAGNTVKLESEDLIDNRSKFFAYRIQRGVL